MLFYIVRRMFYMIPILIGITLVTFLLFNVLGNPAYIVAGSKASAEEIKVVERQLGLDQSLPIQYFNFLKELFTLNFGRSWATKQKISTMLKDGIGASLSLSIPPFVLGTLLSISIALLLAYFREGILDKIVMTTCLAFMSVSFLVYILFFQYVFAYKWGWFPISGWNPGFIERWEYLVLPGLIWVIVSQGSGVLFYRTVMMDEVSQDYVRTANAKGLSQLSIYFKHILKNAMIPILTIVILRMPFLLTGSILLENFFGIPGVGNMMVVALNNTDFPVVKVMTVIGSILYMFFNLLSDVCYAIVDPRVELGKRS